MSRTLQKVFDKIKSYINENSIEDLNDPCMKQLNLYYKVLHQLEVYTEQKRNVPKIKSLLDDIL